MGHDTLSGVCQLVSAARGVGPSTDISHFCVSAHFFYFVRNSLKIPAPMTDTEDMNTEQIDIVFDGPPANESGRFIEVEDSDGASISIGDWVKRDDGYWCLRIRDVRVLLALEEKVENMRDSLERIANNLAESHPMAGYALHEARAAIAKAAGKTR